MDRVNDVGTADPVACDGWVDDAPKPHWRRGLHLPSAHPADLPSDTGTPRWVPLAIVALAVGFNLWVLRAEVLPVRQLNDSSLDQSMILLGPNWIEGGHLPFDGWYPYLGLGSSLFHHYQSLAHTLTAYLALAILDRTGPSREPSISCSGSLPVSVYLGARLLGWERWPAAGAALISPLIVSIPGYGYEHGSYTWRGLGGVWSQLWGMWLLPLAWGFSWRAVSGRSKSFGVAALFVGLTCACHFITGYMALLVLPIWVFDQAQSVRKAPRASGRRRHRRPPHHLVGDRSTPARHEVLHCIAVHQEHVLGRLLRRPQGPWVVVLWAAIRWFQPVSTSRGQPPRCARCDRLHLSVEVGRASSSVARGARARTGPLLRPPDLRPPDRPHPRQQRSPSSSVHRVRPHGWRPPRRGGNRLYRGGRETPPASVRAASATYRGERGCRWCRTPHAGACVE